MQSTITSGVLECACLSDSCVCCAGLSLQQFSKVFFQPYAQTAESYREECCVDERQLAAAPGDRASAGASVSGL